MKKVYSWIIPIIVFILFANLSEGYAQTKTAGKYEAVLYGYIKSAYTGESVIGATIFFPTLGKGTTADVNGYYEVVVPRGKFTVTFGSVNTRKETMVIDLVKNKRLDIELKDETLNLEEVTVFAEKQDANVKSLDVGKSELDIKKINAMPTFMGEPDVIKGLMMLPGVTTVGEGASGYNVRGGSVDQNLILQDGGFIFNPSHVFGFFSVFNPAMVKSATLYKSGMPSKYGGRLSSVLNVDLKEGDMQDFKVEGGVGLISSKIAVQGPILKNKLSFIIGGRMSYSDWLLRQAKDLQLRKSSAVFQDFNAKFAYILNDNNKFTYSGYISHDGFAFASDTTFDWTTINHVLKWDHIVSDRTHLDATYARGEYAYTIENKNGSNPFDIKSKIGYQNLRLNLEHKATTKNTINGGLEATYYQFEPGSQTPIGSESRVKEIHLEDEQSLELGIYAEDEYKFTERFSARAGLRFSYFENFGSGTDYIYGENDSRNTSNITDTVYYSGGESIAKYNGFEPRVTLNYELTTTSSIKASYNRSRQYLHLVTNTAAVTPSDIWKTSNFYIPPEVGDQFSLGYFRNFKENTIETSVEAYYKKSRDIVEFKNGAVLLMNENIEADLINGDAESYGIEFYLNKKVGRLTGWVSYTYSRSFRQVNGRFDDEIISLGKKYSSNYDKPHDITMVMNYKTSPLVEFGMNFTYSTGRPSTSPLQQYDLGNVSGIFGYSLRNEERIPDYHRLDLSMTVKSKPKIDRKWRMSWTVAIYNVYARKNAYSVFYKNVDGSPPRAYKLAVLGTAFPSIMLNFEF